MNCWLSFSLVLLLPCVLLSQQKEKEKSAALAPLPAAVPAPTDNPTTPAKVELGRQLFFDVRLSGNNRISCASCHEPGRAFTDGRTLSTGAAGRALSRNTRSCLNAGFATSLLADGRAASLEEQALLPIQSPEEMNQPLDELEKELAQVPGYVTQFKAVFGKNPNRQDLARALAAFQRTLVSGPSAFDHFLSGEKDALSADALAGYELFRGEAGCIACHNGPLLSDGKFYRLGVSFRDEGRARVTGKKEDRYRILTPTLRNVAQTGPYMHNGSLKTLDDVVMFYYRGIPRRGRDGLAPEIESLQDRSFSEIPLLVAFLEALTGEVPKITPP
jgi:cytochrome c peroxidase